MKDKAMIEITADHVVHQTAVRPEVARFAVDMETILRNNDHKTGWDNLSIHQLFDRIKGEFEELQREYILQTNVPDGKDRTQRLQDEAIDIANYCMFLCHYTKQNIAKK